MSVPTEEPDADLLLQAYVDGELDAASILAFDRRLATDRDLCATRDRLVALRVTLREAVPREAASDRLRRAMMEGIEGVALPAAPHRARMVHDRPAWRLAMAACLVGAVLGSGATTFLSHTPDERPVMAEAVADHLRAMLAPQPFDVASTDQHTVKPWFTGRLPFAPAVPDLGPAGFTLIGGRVDVMRGQPAAALVYRFGKHLISLIGQPAGSVTMPAGTEQNGFGIRQWTSGEMRYWAISDMAPRELDAFEAAVRASTDTGPGH